MADTYDLLLKGGEVIDPSQDLHRYCDVAFRDGRVAAIDTDIAAVHAEEVIDVRGYLVTPGLIDIHGHFFHRGWPGAVDPDTACLPSGVTTGVDAGGCDRSPSGVSCCHWEFNSLRHTNRFDVFSVRI